MTERAYLSGATPLSRVSAWSIQSQAGVPVGQLERARTAGVQHSLCSMPVLSGTEQCAAPPRAGGNPSKESWTQFADATSWRNWTTDQAGTVASVLHVMPEIVAASPIQYCRRLTSSVTSAQW
jgi:hypothetical protein